MYPEEVSVCELEERWKRVDALAVPSPAGDTPSRDRISGIIILPHFRPATALLDWEKETLRWLDPVVSGFLSPQPPGIVRIGPIRS
jgi:hypothetical protein